MKWIKGRRFASIKTDLLSFRSQLVTADNQGNEYEAHMLRQVIIDCRRDLRRMEGY